MKDNRRVWMVTALAASLSVWGCLGKTPSAPQGPGLTKQDDLEVGAAKATSGSLKMTIQDRRPMNLGYSVNYVPIQEWNKARFTLDKVTSAGATDSAFTAISSGPGPGAGTTWLNNDPATTVDATTLTRTASYTFPTLTPGSGYRLKVELIRMESGTERVIASGTNSGSDGTGFIISTGANTVNVLINLTPVNGSSPTSGGRPIVTIPQPASAGGGAGATPTPPPNTLSNTTTTNSSFSATHFAGANGTTFNAPNTLAATYLNNAGSLELGPDGTVYVASPNFNRILSLNTTTGSNVVAGTGATAYNFDAATNNQATTNNINNPNGMSIDPINNVLYFCDGGNNVIRKIVGGVISDVAGRGGGGSTITNGTSLATGVTVSNPQDVEVDADGSLYFTDYGNGRVCRVTPSDGKIYNVASVTNPRSIVLDRINKTLYVASNNTIKSIAGYDVTASYPYTPATVITYTSAGTPTPLFGGNTWVTKFPNYTYTVAALAYDYEGTLYAAVNQTSTTAYLYNSLTRVPVTASGALQSGRNTEVLGGWNNTGSVPTYLTGTVANITTTSFDQTGYNGLVMDLRNAASTTDPANTLYWEMGQGSAYQGNILQLTLNAL